MNNGLNRKKSYLIYSIMVILLIYKDTPLNKVIGSFGDSFLPALSCIIMLYYIARDGKIVVPKEDTKLYSLLIWIVILSTAFIMIYMLLGKSFVYRGQNIVTKAVYAIITYASFVFYVSIIIRNAKKLSLEELFRPIFATLLLLTFICIIELRQIPNAFLFLHSMGKFPYEDVRLLTREASSTAMLIYNISGLSIYFSLLLRKKKSLIVAVLCSLILAGTTHSKGLIISIGLSIVVFVISSIRRMAMNPNRLIIILIITAFGFYGFVRFMLPTFMTALSNDISMFTSTATRSFTVLIGFLIGIIYPFGTGGGILIDVFPRYMESYVHYMDNTGLNLSEIYGLINGKTDVALNPKSALGLYSVYWGIIGTLFFISIFFDRIRILKKSGIRMFSLLKTIVLVDLFMIAIFSNLEYEIGLILAITNCITYAKENDKMYEKNINYIGQLQFHG